MQTILDIMIQADISKATVHNRLKRLPVKVRPVYQHINGRPVRVFTDEIADQIINWTGAKPGRKKQL